MFYSIILHNEVRLSEATGVCKGLSSNTVAMIILF